MRSRRLFNLFKQAVSSWSADYAPSMGAALSYYTLFSIAPLLLIVISVAGLIFGDDAVRGEVFGQLQGMLGSDGAKAVEDMLQSVNKTGEGIVATLTGIGVLLLGATTVFGELQNALDRIWRAPAREKSSGWWNLLRTRLLSFGMVLGIAFLLMISLVLSAAVSAFGKWFGGGAEAIAHALEIGVSFGLMTVLFALIYKFIPRVHIAWRDVWIGAAVTALLLSIGKFLIGLYLGKSAVASSFGAAGSLVVLMVWVYYAAQIFLLGAEFTWVYAHEYGSRRGEPRPGAEERKPSAEEPREIQPVLPANGPVWSPPPLRKRSPIPAFAAFAAGALIGFFTLDRKITRD